MRKLPILVALVVAAGAPPGARAQVSSGATPVYHGKLDVHPAVGRIDRKTGMGTLRVRGWRLIPSAPPELPSNGIFPAQEPVVVAIGANSFRLPAGSLKSSHRGRKFAYRAPRDLGPPAIRMLRIGRRSDGSWSVSFTLTGVDLSGLIVADPICLPMAVIVGDDDGFSGVDLTSPRFSSPRVALPRGCNAAGDWPWIQS
jgi:hypothetical protein